MNRDSELIGVGSLRSPLHFSVSPLGAQLTSIFVHRESGDSVDLMGQWPGSTGGMTSGFVMAPVIGMISKSGKVLHEGKEYEPGKHGYARKTLFKPVARQENSITLEHIHDPLTTSDVFPFAHKISVAYELAVNTIATHVTIENLDKAAMRYGYGLHPAFKWPLPGSSAKQGHQLTLLNDLPEGTVVYRPRDGRIIGAAIDGNPFDKGNVWNLLDTDFDRDAFFFVFPPEKRGITDISLIYGARNNPLSLFTEMKGWDGFGIWSKPGADHKFICIEPLRGVAIGKSEPAIPEFANIEGLSDLPVGKKHTASMKLSVIGKG